MSKDKTEQSGTPVAPETAAYLNAVYALTGAIQGTQASGIAQLGGAAASSQTRVVDSITGSSLTASTNATSTAANSGIGQVPAASLEAAMSNLTSALQANTAAVSSGASSAGGGASSSSGGAGGVLSGLLGGFGLAGGLLSGLFGLFGGGSSTPSRPQYQRYQAPPTIDLLQTLSDQEYLGGATGQSGAVSTAVPRIGSSSSTTVPERASQPASAPAQVIVQVQAMDSKSFLDRSDDIARAVRQAMLQSNALNGLVSEL